MCKGYVKEAHVQRRHEPTECFSPRTSRVTFRFYDCGFVRIVRDLTVKKCLGAALTLPNDIFIIIFLTAVSEEHRFVLLVSLLVHMH